MKRSKYKKQRARIRKLADKWIGTLGLKWWTIQHLCYAKRKSFAKEHGREAFMRVTSDWRYRVAEIHVNVPALATLTDEHLERYYVHELVHILIEEALVEADDKKDHVECAVEGIARAFIWLRDATRQEGSDGHG